MKKILLSLLIAVCIGSMAAFAACESTEDPPASPAQQAYAQAVELGYEGTYEEFIELVFGKDGQNGTDDEKGEPGEDGLDGLQILTGEAEPSAAQGKEGDLYLNSSTFDLYQKTEGGWIKVGNIQGAQGEDGTDDKDSLSAYEIWLQAGHVGTEQDFLNWLKEGGETTSSEASFLQYYLLDDGTLAVGAGRSQLLSEIEIPAAYQGRAVTRIAYEGFAKFN